MQKNFTGPTQNFTGPTQNFTAVKFSHKTTGFSLRCISWRTRRKRPYFDFTAAPWSLARREWRRMWKLVREKIMTSTRWWHPNGTKAAWFCDGGGRTTETDGHHCVIGDRAIERRAARPLCVDALLCSVLPPNVGTLFNETSPKHVRGAEKGRSSHVSH